MQTINKHPEKHEATFLLKTVFFSKYLAGWKLEWTLKIATPHQKMSALYIYTCLIKNNLESAFRGAKHPEHWKTWTTPAMIWLSN